MHGYYSRLTTGVALKYLGCKAHIHPGEGIQFQMLYLQLISNIEARVTLGFFIQLHQMVPLYFLPINL